MAGRRRRPSGHAQAPRHGPGRTRRDPGRGPRADPLRLTEGPPDPAKPMDHMPPALPGEFPQHQLSRALQTLLRHRAAATGIQTDSGGWARYDDVLALPWVRGFGANPDTLDSLVDNRWPPRAPGQFQRAVIGDHTCIRATRGHTMGHIRLEDVGQRVLPTETGQKRTLYHFVSLSAWQSGNHEKGLSPPGPGYQVVMLSPSPELTGPGRRTFRNTVVIAVAIFAVHRLRLAVYRTFEGDIMVEGLVPPETWLWADHHAPDGTRTRIWHGTLDPPGDDTGSEDSKPPRAPRHAAGSRRAASGARPPSRGRTRSAPRAPPPPPDDAGHRPPAGSRDKRTPPRGQHAGQARGRAAAAGPPARSLGLSPSTYSDSASSPGARPAVATPAGPARSLGSHASRSGCPDDRGIYATGRSHTLVPAHDGRASRVPPRRHTRRTPPARRSPTPLGKERSVVMAAPDQHDDPTDAPVRYWAPPVGRSAPIRHPTQRPTQESRHRLSGPRRDVRAVSRDRRDRRGRRREREA